MKRPIRLLTAFGLIAALGACSDDGTEKQAAAPVEESTTVAPATTSAPAPTEPAVAVPSKIVSLSAAATEMLFAIGAGPQVIAVDSTSNFPADAPITELSGFEPNVEAIAATGADLVVLSDDMNNVVAGLTALKIPVLQTPAAVTLDDSFAQIEQLGAATGHIAEAAELVKNMQTEIDEIVAEAKGAAPATPLSFYHELDPTYYSATSATFIGQIYDAFGLVNIADKASTDDDFGYPQLSAEYIVTADPDLIFLADVKCCQANTAAVGARDGWAGMKAVTGKGVVELDDDIASRWGPRVVDQYRTVAAALAKLPVG
jgi:iron complex transport system substrate-binding protein